MKRKVIQLAGKTLVVSLPHQWVKKYGVKKSDEVDVSDKDNTITITAGDTIVVPKKTTVDLSGLTIDFVKSIISVLHKVGYDEIECLYDRPEIARAIRERTAGLIGFELIEQTPKRCVVKSVSGDDHQEFDNMVRRTFLVTLSLAEGSYQLIRQRNYSDLVSVLHFEETNNRLTNYCHRLLNKESKGASSMFTYTILWILEKIADHYRDICISTAKRASPVDPSVLQYYADVNTHLKDYYTFFYGKSLGDVEELRKKNAYLRTQLQQTIVEDPKDHEIVLSLFALVCNLYDCLGSTTGRKFLIEHQESFS